MFEKLTDRVHGLFRRLRGHGTLTERDLHDAAEEVRQALLEADVHHTVVDQVLIKVQSSAVGQEVIKSLTPADQYLRVLYETVVEILGGETKPFSYGSTLPAVILCVGLQGSGKTTTAAKLALAAKQQGRRPLLVPADLQRPAAVAQLLTVAREWDLPTFDSTTLRAPLDVVEAALEQARTALHDTVIIDTAGRLHIDAPLMDELRAIYQRVTPTQTLLVVDAMAGQQGLVAAQGFHAVTPLTGVIVSKADGDARGGVVLSCAAVCQVPIYFVGTGEKIDALEPFYPDRMASRIVGMGDLATLAERVATITDQATTLERVRKLANGAFTLEDYRAQLREMCKVEQWGELMQLVPGMARMTGQLDFDKVRSDVRNKEAIINSMTLSERGDVRLLNGSRRKRIAQGSGTSVTEVNRLIKEFEILQKMMKKGGRKRGVPPEMLQLLRTHG
ncbi:MAG: signal recognition particle protein [Deltaproteobacteria bacterium]|nr:signal recognition particle protein [Deltaproteobacteria bacterium]